MPLQIKLCSGDRQSWGLLIRVTIWLTCFNIKYTQFSKMDYELIQLIAETIANNDNFNMCIMM